MRLIRPSQFTLQGLIFLTRQPPDHLVMVKSIAEELGLPEFYFSKQIQAID